MRIIRWMIEGSWRKVARDDKKRMADFVFDEGIAESDNLLYLSDGDPYHLLDIYYPEGKTGRLPVIVDIHGGGWMYGDKEINKGFAFLLAKAGFAVVNISYRLCPKYTIDEVVRDVYAALSALPRLAQDQPLDMKNVFITGDSAGGMLTLLCTAIATSEKLQDVYKVGKLPYSIRAIAPEFPSVYLHMGMEGHDPIMLEYGRILLGPKGLKNPVSGYASIEDYMDYADYPPIYLLTATDCQYNYQAKKLHAALSERGVEHEYKEFVPDQGEKLGHVYNVLYPHREKGREMTRGITDFFTRHLADASSR